MALSMNQKGNSELLNGKDVNVKYNTEHKFLSKFMITSAVASGLGD